MTPAQRMSQAGLPRLHPDETPCVTTLLGLQVMEYEALRRWNYANGNCPKWHAILTQMQRHAMAKADQAYEEIKALAYVGEGGLASQGNSPVRSVDTAVAA